MSAKDLPGGRTQVLKVHQIRRIDRHPAKSEEESSTESNWDNENWLNSNGDLDNSHNSEDDLEAENDSDIELGNGSVDSETPEEQNERAAPNLPGLIRPIWRSKKKAEMLLKTVNIMETRRNKGIKKT